MDGPGKLCLVSCCYKLGVITGSSRDQAGHDALVINNNGFNSTCNNCQFRHEMIPCHWHTLAHKQLITSAAEAGQVDPLGARRLGVLDDLGVLRRRDDHLAERRLVAVHYNVTG